MSRARYCRYCRYCKQSKPPRAFYANNGRYLPGCRACRRERCLPEDCGFARTREDKYPPTLRLCECSRCGRELLGEGQPREPWYPEPVAGRCYGRPSCWRCLPAARREARPPEATFVIPSQE